MATINKTMKTLNVPSGNDTVCYEIVDEAIREAIGTVPTGHTVMGDISDVKSALSKTDDMLYNNFAIKIITAFSSVTRYDSANVSHYTYTVTDGNLIVQCSTADTSTHRFYYKLPTFSNGDCIDILFKYEFDYEASFVPAVRLTTDKGSSPTTLSYSTFEQVIINGEKYLHKYFIYDSTNYNAQYMMGIFSSGNGTLATNSKVTYSNFVITKYANINDYAKLSVTDNLSSRIDNVITEIDYSLLASSFDMSTLEAGRYNNSGGKSSDSYSLRCPEKMQIPCKYMVFEVPTGYVISVQWSQTASLSNIGGKTDYIRTRNVVYFNEANANYYCFTIRKPDSSTLTSEEITEIKTGSKIYYGIEIDKTLTKSNAAADAKTVGDIIKKYELPANWSNNLNDIQKAQGTKITFAIQTDTHLYGSQADEVIPLSVLTKYIGFDFIANLGDIIRGYENDTTDSMRTIMRDVVKNYTNDVNSQVVLLVGNHDDNTLWGFSSDGGGHTESNVILPDEIYAKYSPIHYPTKANFNGKNYYYIDFEKYRLICLDTRDIDLKEMVEDASVTPSVAVNTHGISDVQLSWLTNEALNTEKAVIIASHIPLNHSYTSSAWNRFVTNGDAVLSAVASFVENGGSFICYLAGHTHEQASVSEEYDGYTALHLRFDNGAEFAEIVMIDLVSKTISTKMIGNVPTGVVDRSFTFE